MLYSNKQNLIWVGYSTLRTIIALLFCWSPMCLFYSRCVRTYRSFRITAIACMASWVHRRLLVHPGSSSGSSMVSLWWWWPGVAPPFIIWWTSATFTRWNRPWTSNIITVISLLTVRWCLHFWMGLRRWRYWIRPLWKEKSRKGGKRKNAEVL